MQRSDSTILVNTMSLQHAALVTGFAYLLNPVTFAEAYAMPRLVASDPAQTLTSLTAHPHLFATAILSYAFSALGDVVIAWSLYILLAPVHRALAALGSLLQLTYAAVWLAAISHLGLLYRLISVPDYSRHGSPSELPLRVEELLGGFHSGWGLGLILFGLHLVVTGWLITRSAYLPHWLGWLLFIDGWAWVLDNLSVYLYPNAALGFLNVFFGAELVFMIWLLGWGWRMRDPEPALTYAIPQAAEADPSSRRQLSSFVVSALHSGWNRDNVRVPSGGRYSTVRIETGTCISRMPAHFPSSSKTTRKVRHT